MTRKSLIASAPARPNLLINVFSASVLFALSLGLLVSCSQTNSKTESDSSKAAETKAEFTPEAAEVQSNFNAVAYEGPTFTLATPDGSTMTFTDMLGRGKPLVINFWGTWCGPCRREMPEFIKIYDEYKSKGLQLVGVALRDTPAKVTAYTSQKGITWPQVLGTMETAEEFGGITGVPTTIIYDSQGVELSRYVGPMSYDMFKQRLETAFLHETEIASL